LHPVITGVRNSAKRKTAGRFNSVQNDVGKWGKAARQTYTQNQGNAEIQPGRQQRSTPVRERTDGAYTNLQIYKNIKENYLSLERRQVPLSLSQIRG